MGGWLVGVSEAWERTHKSLNKKNSLDLPFGCNKISTLTLTNSTAEN